MIDLMHPHVEELIRCLQQPGSKVGLFSGAGLSKSTWGAFIDDLIYETEGTDPAAAAQLRQWVAQKNYLVVASKAREVLKDRFYEVLERSVANLSVTEAQRQVTLIDEFSGHITTNYDVLLERACEDAGYDCHVAVWNDPTSLELCRDGERFFVLHAHGIVSDRASIVLGAEDYAAIKANTAYQSKLRELLSMWTFLFIGSGMEEEIQGFLTLIRGTYSGPPRHFLLLPVDKGQEDMVVEQYRLQSNIKVIPFTTDGQYKEVNQFLEHLHGRMVGSLTPSDKQLADQVRSLSTERLRGETISQDVYVQPHIFRPSDLEHDHFLWDAETRDVAVGLGSSKSLTFSDIFKEKIGVVYADFNTGKSTFLAHMCLWVSENRVTHLPLYIRLNGYRGERELSLFIVSRLANSVHIPLAESFLGRHPLHLCLDGLDELGKYYHDFIGALRRFIAKHPIHKVLLSTRKVNMPFQRGDLVNLGVSFYELLPFTRRQIHSFLLARSLHETPLAERVFSDKELVGICSNPGFLTGLVAIHATGKPVPRTYSAVYPALLDRALHSQQFRGVDTPRLQTVSKRLLRRCALTMMELRTTVIGQSDLEAIVLGELSREPSLSSVTPSTLLSDVVDATILILTENGYSFQHRSWQEFLTAEALLAESEFCIINRTFVHERNLSGFDPHWYQVFRFLVELRPTFIRALRKREPLLAARCVPANAEASLRTWAFEALFSHYGERTLPIMGQLWGRQIYDDFATLVSLNPPLAARFLGSFLTSETRTPRFNAVNLLAELHPARLEQLVPTLLVDDVREIRKRAIRLVADQGWTHYAKHVHELYETESDWEVSSQAIRALSVLGAGTPAFFVDAYRRSLSERSNIITLAEDYALEGLRGKVTPAILEEIRTIILENHGELPKKVVDIVGAWGHPIAEAWLIGMVADPRVYVPHDVMSQLSSYFSPLSERIVVMLRAILSENRYFNTSQLVGLLQAMLDDYDSDDIIALLAGLPEFLVQRVLLRSGIATRSRLVDAGWKTSSLGERVEDGSHFRLSEPLQAFIANPSAATFDSLYHVADLAPLDSCVSSSVLETMDRLATKEINQGTPSQWIEQTGPSSWRFLPRLESSFRWVHWRNLAMNNLDWGKLLRVAWLYDSAAKLVQNTYDSTKNRDILECLRFESDARAVGKVAELCKELSVSDRHVMMAIVNLLTQDKYEQCYWQLVSALEVEPSVAQPLLEDALHRTEHQAEQRVASAMLRLGIPNCHAEQVVLRQLCLGREPHFIETERVLQSFECESSGTLLLEYLDKCLSRQGEDLVDVLIARTLDGLVRIGGAGVVTGLRQRVASVPPRVWLYRYIDDARRVGLAKAAIRRPESGFWTSVACSLANFAHATAKRLSLGQTVFRVYTDH